MEREWLLVITEMLLLYCLVPGGHGQTMPTGCTYDSGMFECDYSTLDSNGDIPVPAADFSPIPQRLRLINLPSSLTSSIFDSDFAALSTSDYDTNYPATLELKCGNSNSTMSISSPFLDNMGHVQDFRIINCHLGNVPSGAFAELGTLDRFSIENGSIASMNSGLLTGVTIKKDPGASPTFPIHRGEFAMRHTKLSGSLPADFLSGQTYIHTVILDGLGVSSVSSIQFTSNTKLRFLSLGWNDLTELPSGLFDGLASLTEIRLYDTSVTCSCDDLWFITHAQEKFISIHGDIVCNSGSYADKYAMQYYNDVCASVTPATCSGIQMMNSCIGLINFMMLVISFIAFCLGFVVLAFTISTRKEMAPGSNTKTRIQGTRKAPSLEVKNRGPANTRKGWA